MLPVKRGESHSLIEHHEWSGLNRREVPYSTLIPRNDSVNAPVETVEQHASCPVQLLQNSNPLFHQVDSDEVKISHLPKYQEVKKHLDQIKKTCLRDFNVPLKTTEIKREYPKSLYFGDIYNYSLVPISRKLSP